MRNLFAQQEVTPLFFFHRTRDTSGGTVSGNAIHAQQDTISGSDGFAGSNFANGSKTGSNTLTLLTYAITASGSINGTCNISPALDTSMTISSTAPLVQPGASSSYLRPLSSDDLVRWLKQTSKTK